MVCIIRGIAADDETPAEALQLLKITGGEDHD
jgi:hypothetical protein